MASSARVKERVAGSKRGEFLFVAHVAAPDGGFGRSLDDVNQLSRHGSGIQRRWRPRRLAEREAYGWCLEGLELAKSLRHRFGGQIVPITAQPIPQRRDAASQNSAAVESELEKASKNQI